MRMLEDPPHVYDCGRSRTKTEQTLYNKRYSRLKYISKKLIVNFFNKELNLSFPVGYSLFESVKGEPGLFKPIFRIKDGDTSQLCSSKSDFIYKFSRANKDAKRFPNDKNSQHKVIDLIVEARKKSYISETEVNQYWKCANNAAERIKRTDDNQSEIQPQDPNYDTVENIDKFSDGTF